MSAVCRICFRDNITLSVRRRDIRIAFCGQTAWRRTIHPFKQRLSNVIRREIGQVTIPVGDCDDEVVYFVFLSPQDCLCVVSDCSGLPSVVLARYKETFFFHTFRTFCFVVKLGESLYVACCVCHEGRYMVHGVGGRFPSVDMAVAMVKDQFRRLPLGPYYWE